MTTSTEMEQPATPTEAWKAERRERIGAFADLDRLEEAIEESEFERSDAVFSLELARRSEFAPEGRRALFVTLLAASVARRRGSVRLDLTSEGVEGLAGRLRDLLPNFLESDDEARQIAEQTIDVLTGESSSSLVGEAGDYRPVVVDDGHFYRHADRVEERRLADALASRLIPEWRDEDWPDSAEFTEDDVAGAMDRVVDAADLVPTPEQQFAIATAATSPLSVITGGPGTGKTSLIVSLLRLLGSLEVDPEDVALAAPTGKAADRLGAAIDEQLDSQNEIDRQIVERLEEPATIHRLLSYSQRRRAFYHDAFRPLPHEYVVVDEASMIDLELMDRLVAAVDDDAKLVLVGDADQLPAVGSGAAFRDLVPGTVHTATPRRHVLHGDELDVQSSDEAVAAQSIRLTENFRMRQDDPEGSNVLAVAQAVRDGGGRLDFLDAAGVARDGGAELDLAEEVAGEDVHGKPVITKRSSFEELEFRGAELLSGASGDWIEQWYDRLIAEDVLGGVEWREPLMFEDNAPSESARERLDGLFGAFEQYQLLGVTRRRPRGVSRLDSKLHNRHVERQSVYDDKLAVGEPIMMTRNDYERGLFNGDRGIVLRVQDQQTGQSRKRAIFPRRSGYAAFTIGPLRAHLDYAWSLTVHKAQGSEYDSVGIVLPRDEIPLATRELLYTGITRARSSVTFFGDPARIDEAARRSDERNTGLVERLERRT